MKRIVKSAKLLEAVGLLMLLGGWLLHWRSVDRWTDAAKRLDSFMQMVTANYHSMQITANVRLEAAASRALPPPTRPEEIDYRLDSYRITWRSPDVRRLWLTRAVNDVVSLKALGDHLELINNEFELDGGALLMQPRDQLLALSAEIDQLTNGKEIRTPSDVPVPALDKLSIEKANEIEALLAKAAESELATYSDI